MMEEAHMLAINLFNEPDGSFYGGSPPYLQLIDTLATAPPDAAR